MRRMLVAILLLALIAMLWATEQRAIDRICDGMLDNIKRLKEAEIDGIDEMLEQTEQDWKKHEGVLEMLTPHENTDEININWASYKSRIKEGNYTAAGYVLDEMSQRFEELSEKTKVSIENIF